MARPLRIVYPGAFYHITSQRNERKDISDFIFGYFGKKDSDAQRGYRAFVETLIGQKYKSPLKEVMSSTILGSVDFIEAIKDKYLFAKKVVPNHM